MSNTRTKQTRITGADRAKLAGELTERYIKGASIREVARDFGRSYGFAHRILVENNVPRRPRGGNTRNAAAK